MGYIRTRLGKGTAHPFCPHQQLSLVTWPHLTIMGRSCVPRIKREQVFMFYPWSQPFSSALAEQVLMAYYWLWLFHHFQWREYFKLISVLWYCALLLRQNISKNLNLLLAQMQNYSFWNCFLAMAYLYSAAIYCSNLRFFSEDLLTTLDCVYIIDHIH